MFKDAQPARFAAKYLFRPDLTFLIYFALVGIFGLAKKDLLLLYLFVFPWIALVILFLNLPFFHLLFHGVRMSESAKVNHVLEHGTIHFLRSMDVGSNRLGGNAQENGFRIHGGRIKEKIPVAFDRLVESMNTDTDGIVLSRYCGSSTPFLQAISLVIVTASFILFLVVELKTSHVLWILAADLSAYLLLRFPLSKLAQKTLTMSFQFRNPRIRAIRKTKADGVFERAPVYFVETEWDQSGQVFDKMRPTHQRGQGAKRDR